MLFVKDKGPNREFALLDKTNWLGRETHDECKYCSLVDFELVQLGVEP